MSELHRALRLRDGTVLAIGSIAGSGILFLPSLTYSLVGHDALLSWLGAMLLGVPMLFMFTDMVRTVADGSGIEGFVARGLGPHVAASVPFLFLGLFFIGMPAGVLVAGDYLRRAVGGGPAIQLLGALAILVGAVVTNLLGVRTGALVQNAVTWGMLMVGLALIALTFPEASQHYDAVRPTLTAVGPILSGVVVAFWAFAGFENLTFIAGEFRNPRRDFFVAMIIAFFAYGGLAVALTANIAGAGARPAVDQLSGLFQLAETISPRWLSTSIVAAFALALMQINATSWVWGMSRLIFASASAHRLPSLFGRLDARQLPRRAIVLLGAVLIAVTCVFTGVPRVLVEALITASAVFLALYVLCVVSYWHSEASITKRASAGALLLVLVTTLAGAGFRILYPVIVFVVSVGVSVLRARHGTPPAMREATRSEVE